MILRGRKALVLGLGESGLSTAKWLAGQGARLRVADSRQVPPGLAELRAAAPDVELHLGAWRDASFEGVDLIAISPGLPREIPQVQRALAGGVPVVGDVELFAQSLPSTGDATRPRILAITGTNGKTTVTTLTGLLCRAAGWDVEVAGNIGPAVLAALSAREAGLEKGGRMPQAWVLELSSFQLESTETLCADAAVMLNLTEDHLDRHAGMGAYATAKARIFQGEGVQVLNRDDPNSIAMALTGRQAISFGLNAPPTESDFGLVYAEGRTWLAQGSNLLMPAGQLQIAGLHNAANALAALALVYAVGLPLQDEAGAPVLAALRAFRGLPHRVELVGERGSVRFYDDSKGTNVGSTVAALKGLAGESGKNGGKVVLIAGGEGKGQDFSPLLGPVSVAARAVILIGRDAVLIKQALSGSGVAVLHAATMEGAVKLAAECARAGDAVLLSPACASFDMFRDYKHRGEMFVAAVKALGALPQGAHHA